MLGRDYESAFTIGKRRDHTATIIAAGQGRQRLLVNGVGITVPHPATKMMAHLPLASMDRAPHNACNLFWRGNQLRSLPRGTSL